MRFLRIYGLYFAWIASLIGLFASLYYSEIRHLEPCSYCWYQRIALFPLAIQLGIFAYRRDGHAALYGLPLCLLGFCAAVLQSLDVAFDIRGLCKSATACNQDMIYLFNLIPFSWFSGVGFLFIAALLWMCRFQSRKLSK